MTLLIKTLCDIYQVRSNSYYRKPSGRPTREAGNVHDSMRALLVVYPDLPACELRARHLRVLQDYMATGVCELDHAPDISPVSRTTINARIRRILRMIRWAAEYDHVPDDQPHRLSILSPLKPGRTAAIEHPPVMPVSWDDVSSTLDALERAEQSCHPHHINSYRKLRVMIELHWYIGCRPGELVIMRKSSVDRSGEVWVYTPAEHKCQHHNQDRVVFIGPKARTILQPWWDECQADVLFPGRRSDSDPMKINGPAPMSPGSYAQAITRINKKNGLTHWAPNQIRHAAATRFREEGGLESAQVMLGHSRASTTEIYALKNHQAGIDTARKCA